MLLPDVNVLVDAFITDSVNHERAARWLEHAVNVATEEVILLDVVLLGFVRISSHPKMLATPRPLPEALDFVDSVLAGPFARRAQTSDGHWDRFRLLATQSRAQGGGVTDAYIAALGAQLNAEVITFDRGFARFPGLRWSEPPAL